MIAMDFTSNIDSETVYDLLVKLAGNSPIKRECIGEAIIHVTHHYSPTEGSLRNYCSRVLSCLTKQSFQNKGSSYTTYDETTLYEKTGLYTEQNYTEDILVILYTIETSFISKLLNFLDETDCDQYTTIRETKKMVQKIRKELSQDTYNFAQTLELIRLVGYDKTIELLGNRINKD